MLKRKSLTSISTILLTFIFCGAIIGETISLSLIITTLGPAIIGKLYLVNAAVLLLLPIMFFQTIDRNNRGELLNKMLLITVACISVLTVIICFGEYYNKPVKIAIIVLYPVAYLSKTILFLIYWTLLNDIYSIKDAKEKFPVIAAWGFIGAIGGVVIATIFLKIVSAHNLLFLWIMVYLFAWFLTRNLKYKNKKQLYPVEGLPSVNQNIFGQTDLLSNKLVRIISLFYYLSFVTVFTIDFLFWKTCYKWYMTPDSVASFQFSFYLVHAIFTVVLLRYSLPSIIRKVGFTYIMYALPLAFFIGGMVMFSVSKNELDITSLFVLVGVQFLRYVLFELTFAPSYQMFFAAVIKEQRGRVKTFLEGVIKPLAILTSGIVLVFTLNHTRWLYVFISFLGICLCVVINHLRKTYGETIVKESAVPLEINEVIEDAGLVEDDEIYTIVNEYASSNETDLRTVAIHLLQRIGSVPALELLEAIYKREKEIRVKQSIARNINTFFTYRAKGFIGKLLNEGDARIRSNAIYAVNEIKCNWKKHLKDVIAPMLFEENLRIQVESARFLWREGNSYDRSSVKFFIRKLLESRSNQRVAAALYLIGEIEEKGWEERLFEYLPKKSFQVFSRAVDMLIKKGSKETQINTLVIVEGFDRRHISFLGSVVSKAGMQMVDAIISFMPLIRKKRMFYEMSYCLWKISIDKKTNLQKRINTSEIQRTIKKWIADEMYEVFLNISYFVEIRNWFTKYNFGMLETAMRENQLRFCSWVIRLFGIIYSQNGFFKNNRECNLHNIDQRNEIIEVLESIPADKVMQTLLPLLKEESWENLAKLGETVLQIKTDDDVNGIEHLLSTENRFVVLSMLYTVYKNMEVYYTINIRDKLNHLTQSKNRIIKTAAMDIVENLQDNRIKRSKALELLEGVLLLKKTDIFKSISAEKLLRLVEITHLVEFQKNEIVSQYGKMADQLYILKSGRLKIIKGNRENTESFTYLDAGNSYGEIGLFSKSVRKATVVAEKRSMVYIIKNDDIKRLIRELPDIGFNLLESISTRLLRITDENDQRANSSS